MGRDIVLCHRLRFIGYAGAVSSKIRDQGNCTAAFDLNALIELLRDPHRLLRREVQCPARFLLKGGSRERKRRFPASLGLFHLSDFKARICERICDRLDLFFIFEFLLYRLSVPGNSSVIVNGKGICLSLR